MRRGAIPGLAVMVMVAAVLGYTTALRMPHRVEPQRHVPVVTVVDGQPVPDMKHGEQLDIVMPNTAANEARCWDMGGTPNRNDMEGTLTCRDVDF